MGVKFDMDYAASSMSRYDEEGARFQNLVADGAMLEPPAAPAPSETEPGPAFEPLCDLLFRDDTDIVDALKMLIDSDERARLALDGCVRIDTHVSRECKRRMKVFCADHDLTMRQVTTLALERLVGAMNEYEERYS